MKPGCVKPFTVEYETYSETCTSEKLDFLSSSSTDIWEIQDFHLTLVMGWGETCPDVCVDSVGISLYKNKLLVLACRKH